VVLVCDPSLRDLQAFRGRGALRAGRGGHGRGANRHGADGEDLELRVPPGTAVQSEDAAFRYDLTTPGARAVVAAGGSGGRGNRRFTSARRQAPRFAERGLPGEERGVELRLKLIADAGLVGLPNAGKSSLLGRLTRARPKVAGYPFTTVDPALGTIEAHDRQIVVADIPGLIEGAGQGAGLGHEFLAHVERTRLLVHVLEAAPADGADPVAAHATIEAELAAYGAGLERLPRILCLSKADLLPEADAEAAAEEWRGRLGDRVLGVVLTSAATGRGIAELAAAIAAHLPGEAGALPDGATPMQSEPRVPAAHRLYRPGAEEGFRVERTAAGAFRVAGRQVERLVARHDLGNREALRHVEDRLAAMGVIRALEAEGFSPGDDVEIGGVSFDLDPGAPFR
ncbi:MAG TPA: Obg family GTPase CgtA, partial [Thermoleophilaceae bacterium]|nr:Obg family GTPase CgtA [Thermoleophilaceae bacterium]